MAAAKNVRTPTAGNAMTTPRQWLTVDDLKSISGCALCTWLVTMFFDLVFFSTMEKAGRQKAVLITGIITCLILTVFRFVSDRIEVKKGTATNKQGKNHILLIIPNALLIYIHALGFQVGSKEAALRLYRKDFKAQDSTAITKEPQSHLAGFFLFSWFTEQTSWLPSKTLTDKVAMLEAKNKELQVANNDLTDSLNLTKQRLNSSFYYQEYLRLSDTLNEHSSRNAQLIDENATLQLTIRRLRDSLAAVRKGVSYYVPYTINPQQLRAEVITLRGRITVHNESIWAWEYRSRNIDRAGADSIRYMLDRYMGNGYSQKLFTPIDTSLNVKVSPIGI